MKRYFLLIAFFALTIGAFAQPKIEIVGGDTYDWGETKSTQQKLTTTLVVKNAGDMPLKIYSVNPTCGCTTAPISKSEIAPNDTASIYVTLNISTYSGKVQKTIDVRSNDPSAAQKTIWLKTYVIKPISLFPQYFNFANMSVGKETLSKIIITNSTNEPIKITKVDIYPNDLKLNIKEGDELKANSDFTLEAIMIPQIPGRFQANVKFETSSKDTPEIIINGFGSVIQPSENK
jgi:hypothetical protein